MNQRHRQLRELFRQRIAQVATGVEIFISILVLLAIVIVGLRVVLEVLGLARDPSASEHFDQVLGHAFNLIIGVEFIKMLAKHTPGSAIEVLLFAIARKLVVEHPTSVDMLLGIVSIALIFIIRKFWFVPSFGAHRPDNGEAGSHWEDEEEAESAKVDIH